MKKSDMDAMLVAIDRREQPEFIWVSPFAARTVLQEVKPHVYALYQAAWRSGFTVNGIPANG